MNSPVITRWKGLISFIVTIAFLLLLLMSVLPRGVFSSPEQYPLISDQQFVFHPTLFDFDIEVFLQEQNSGLLSYSETVGTEQRSAAETIHDLAHYYSINPQVLLTLLELQTGAVSSEILNQEQIDYAFQFPEAGLSNQLNSVAEHLLRDYYGHKTNAAANSSRNSVSLNSGTLAITQYYDEFFREGESRDRLLSRQEGSFYDVFSTFFGDPLAGNLVNVSPSGPMRGARLPWLAGETWNYNSGPHNYSVGVPQCTDLSRCPLPWSSLDFGTMDAISCSANDGGGTYSPYWAAAALGGKVVQASSSGIVIIDHLDGWFTYYVHLSQTGLVKPGDISQGDPVGHPSCAGKTSGVHTHFAINYEGEFQNIDKLNLSGWTVAKTNSNYDGTMTCPDGRLKKASASRTDSSKIADDCEPSATDRLSVVMIIDSTGSMSSNDPRRMRVDAAKAFIQAAEVGDEIGIVDFDSSARELAPMTIIQSENDKNRLINAVDQVRTYGSTNINAGLNTGFNTISSASGSGQRRTAILLTDGDHNVGSYDPRSHLQYKDQNWPIYTVGLGQANQSLLLRIAGETGGKCVNSCLSITDASQLGQLYQDIRALLTNSSTTTNRQVKLQPGQQVSVPSAVPPNQFSTLFYIGWQGSDVDLTLISPSGRIFDPGNLGPGIQHAKGPTYELYRVDYPESGNWSMSIYGKDIPAGGENVNVYASTLGIRYFYSPFTVGAPEVPATATPLPPTLTPVGPTPTSEPTATPSGDRSWQVVGAGSASGGGISNNGGESNQPTVAVAQDGSVYVAWSDNSGGDEEIYVKRWNGGSWQAVGSGSASGGGISNNSGQSKWAAIAVAADGTPYVAWRDWSSGKGQIYVRRWNGSQWQEVGSGSAAGGGISDSSADSGRAPSIAIGLDGTPYVAWRDYDGSRGQIYVKRWNGSQWTEVGNHSAHGGGISNNNANSVRPSIAVAPDAKPVVAWMDYSANEDGAEIYVRRWNGSIWEEIGSGSATGGGISKNNGDSHAPWIAIAPDGMPFISWHDNSSGDYEIYVRRWNGTAWAEVGSGSAQGGGISNNSGDSLQACLDIASDGTPYVVWYDISGGDAEIYVRYWNGSSWSEAGTGSASGGGVSSNNGASSLPELAVSPSGVPYVAWGDDSSGNYEIYIKMWSD